MKVLWTQASLRHLTGIYHQIAADSPEYALRMVDRITRRSKQLAAFPKSGGQVLEYRDPNLREVIEKPYRVIYRTHDNHVEVLAIIHGARDMPSSPDDLA